MKDIGEEENSIESLSFFNGKLIEHSKQTCQPKWILEDELFGANNISIGSINPAYIEVNEIQDKADEYKKIKRFLNIYLKRYAERKGIPVQDLSIEFINYGKTELVYVLSEKNGKRVTLLVKQPAVQLGKVNQEAKNLIDLKKRDKNVIAPIDYFQIGDQELYVTPYINQARCVASYGSWGMYVPEPYYRFESFTADQERIVNSCIIAKLVSLYDFEKQEGLCSCKLGGGDFMLPKGWETQTPTISNTFNNLYLIAAREKIKCSYEQYLSIIRDEFSRATITEAQKDLIINLRGRVPMKVEDIEHGIKLAQSIIQKNNEQATAITSISSTVKDDYER